MGTHLNLSKSIQSAAGLKALKFAANGCYGGGVFMQFPVMHPVPFRREGCPPTSELKLAPCLKQQEFRVPLYPHSLSDRLLILSAEPASQGKGTTFPDQRGAWKTELQSTPGLAVVAVSLQHCCKRRGQSTV